MLAKRNPAQKIPLSSLCHMRHFGPVVRVLFKQDIMILSLGLNFFFFKKEKQRNKLCPIIEQVFTVLRSILNEIVHLLYQLTTLS